MFVAIIESVKYVGHLFPLAILRVFLGGYYLQLAINHYNGDFLMRPRLAAQISDVLPLIQISEWYRLFIESWVIPHWQVFAFLVVGLEFAIAISYLIGYVVRPLSVLGLLLALNLMILFGSQTEDLYRTFMVVHLVLAWVGAGRCLGLDYYFFKRKRGIWW